MKRPITAAAILLAAAALPANAQETIEQKAEVCATCHGEDGIPKMPEVPIIWGQHTGYLYIQLKDYKSGYRKHEIMNPIAAEFEKADMLAIAEYFSKKPWPRITYSAEPGDEQKGETMSTAGFCTECHLGGYVGDGSIPRLSGQTAAYLERTMLAFKTRERGNNPDKSTLISSYPDDDIKAMARYLASIQIQ